MTDSVDKKSRLLFVFDNLYNMYKKNKMKRFEDLNLVTFNLTFEQMDEFKRIRAKYYKKQMNKQRSK